MYYQKVVSRKVIIDGQEVVVDSRLEERVLHYLENNGFHDLWIKPYIGLNVGAHHYTPDLELSVFMDGLTHRALVEIKPARSYFTRDIWRRMAGVARHYHTKLLLLYADQENQWYRIDYRTGTLSPFGFPQPGKIPAAKLYKPFAMPASSIYNHRYKRAAVPVIAIILLQWMIQLLSAPFVAPTQHSRHYRRR